MASRKELNEVWESQKRKREQLLKLATRKSGAPASRATAEPRKPEPAPAAREATPPPPVIPRVREALIPVFRDGGTEPSEPSSALVALADLYLHAAQHRSRHIAMVWPASLKTLTVVHALATLARWHQGDKQGVRGLLFPVKTNAFYRLNHIHFDRASILRIAHELVEVDANARVIRPMLRIPLKMTGVSDGS